MATVSSPSSVSIPAGFVEAACIECSAAILVPFGHPFPCCGSCKRSNAQAEAMRLLADVKDLQAGRGIFAGMTPEERREQLRQLVISTDDEKPSACKPMSRALADLVRVLGDTDVDALADIVARRIGERKGKPGRTLVQIAIGDLSDAALIEVIGSNDEPVILNAASMDLARRLGERSDAFAMPLFTMQPGSEPDAATRDELESKIELVPAPVCEPDHEHPLADAFHSDFAA